MLSPAPFFSWRSSKSFLPQQVVNDNQTASTRSERFSMNARSRTWTCHGEANQRWNLNSDGTITNAATGLCLDVSGAATANGTAVQLWTQRPGQPALVLE